MLLLSFLPSRDGGTCTGDSSYSGSMFGERLFRKPRCRREGAWRRKIHTRQSHKILLWQTRPRQGKGSNEDVLFSSPVKSHAPKHLPFNPLFKRATFDSCPCAFISCVLLFVLRFFYECIYAPKSPNIHTKFVIMNVPV